MGTILKYETKLQNSNQLYSTLILSINDQFTERLTHRNLVLEHACFFRGKVMWTKNGLGFILGDFFTYSFGLHACETACARS
jgi:hypothetical protein